MSQPGFFFYTGDWVKDTRVLSAEERGCWIDALCFLKEHGGSVTWPIASYALFWSIAAERACEVLDRLSDLNVAEVEWQTEDGKTIANDGKPNFAIWQKIAKLSNRRMVRLAEHEEHNRQHISEVRSKAGKKGAEKKWQTHGKNSILPSLLLTPDKSLKKDPEPATPGPVDNLKKEEPIARFESKKFTETAKRICGRTPEHLNKLIEWVLSMKTSMQTEPMERVNAVVKLSLEALERHIESGRPIHSLWGLLTTIFDAERTRYMQGPENEGHKSGPIPAEIKNISQGIG